MHLFQMNLRIGRYHALDLHESNERSPFVFVKLHYNIFYGLVQLRYHDVLERVYSATVALYLVGKHIAGLFDLRKPQKLFHERGYFFHRDVEIGRCGQRTVRQRDRKSVV